MIVGTHLKGSLDYRTLDFKNGPIILLMGNENRDYQILLHIDVINLHVFHKVDVLTRNLAVATAVMLYEIRRPYLTLEPCEEKNMIRKSLLFFSLA